jgi:6-pyruvoyltetrahydropterin/6-carboxytetrahydropterin synthase
MTLAQATICKEFTFDAAHRLPHHDGKCAQPHGHTYRVRVYAHGPIQEDGPKAGMVQDFGDIKAAWQEHCEPLLDHQDLNISLAHLPCTTAEWIAWWVLGTLLGHVPGLEAVRVYETPTAYAEVTV